MSHTHFMHNIKATDEGLRGQNDSHSLRVHSCALVLNFVLNYSMSAARMSLCTIVLAGIVI